MAKETTSSAHQDLDPQLLSILCCPETKQPVSLLNPGDLETVNQKIQQGELRNKGGSAIKEPLEGGLLTADRKIVYPIRDAIPIMLIDEGIPVEHIL